MPCPVCWISPACPVLTTAAYREGQCPNTARCAQDELGQDAVTGVVSVAAPEDGEEGVSIHFEVRRGEDAQHAHRRGPEFASTVLPTNRSR